MGITRVLSGGKGTIFGTPEERAPRIKLLMSESDLRRTLLLSLKLRRCLHKRSHCWSPADIVTAPQDPHGG